MKETNKRSLAKTIVYRGLSLAICTVITYLFGLGWGEAFKISFVTFLASTLLYYVHERVWNKVNWGKEVL